MYYKLS